jgi:TM2 domain-containing membrane protein YozV
MTTPPLPPGQDPYQQPPPEYPQAPYPVSGGSQPYSPYPGYQPGYPPGPAGYDMYAYSDKSKVAAGLLQLLPGAFLGLGGIGRLYAGYTSLGIVQIVVSVFGWICFWCGFFFIVPFFVFFGTWLWAVIDGIVLLAGRPVDGQGRPLR